MLAYTPTPTQEIFDPTLKTAGLRLLVKREDLNHPLVSGNKWWKLKYNLTTALEQGHDTVLTFGGAYSNHIRATAAAAQLCGLGSIGVIGGERSHPLNPVLAFASDYGMKLHFITRTEYRTRGTAELEESLQEHFGRFYLIPEGGTNTPAVKGVTELGEIIGRESKPDYCICPVGTGGTLAGLARGLGKATRVIGVSVIRHGEYLEGAVLRFVGDVPATWELNTEYHHGGIGKTSAPLDRFLETFRDRYGIPLEGTYTGKMMHGIFDMVARNMFRRNSVIVALHTGGLL